ncbi:MAG: hypothetical protein U5K72_09210 [Balneolaceae bacterium]|nr:hypothetical protein [Balneolaceae bacterium]
MSNRNLLIKEIKELPDDKLHEVIDFVQFLKSESGKETWEIMKISEFSLAKEWNNPIDNKVWSNL